MRFKDIISINDITKEEIDFILDYSEQFDNSNRNEILNGKVMASIFFEPSTRTRFSFDSAMKQLGGKVLSFSEPDFTSLTKGETLWDSIKMVERYADVIIIRHKLEGAARLASEAANIPVINAGDGTNQHPTQTLLDLYTIKKSFGKIDGLNIGLVGDLKLGRTVHSLASALALYGCNLFFIKVGNLEMPRYVLEILDERNAKYEKHDFLDIKEIIPKLDVLYMTRVQRERFPDTPDGSYDYEKIKSIYVLNKSLLNNAKDSLKIMHPLPRVFEIPKEIDNTKYALYFDQASNGVVVRKALLDLVLRKNE
ncbi:MAG: aspartate carbamoyltransferase [Nanoarchaeota archaeon]|nr:aspartate carbamoyltransferase [Nanoarchaeota archaeon]